jgi:exodeoxyribonuclease-1
MSKLKDPTFLWFDVETSGIHTHTDRIVSFACQRTSLDFIPIEPPCLIYAKPTPDHLPHPSAVMTHRLTPQFLWMQGLSPAPFARRIYQEFNQSHTISIGYNSIRFDDEFIRHLFYRNFYPSYKHTAHRWDLFDVILTIKAIRPQGLNWPENNSLSALCVANGINTTHAHTATGDVQLTYALAKLVAKAQPKLWHFLLNQRSKSSLKPYVQTVTPKPFLHVSRHFTHPTLGHNCMPVLPITPDQHNPNKIWIVNLALNPEILLDLSVDDLYTWLFVKPVKPQLVAIKGFHLNRTPIALPWTSLQSAEWEVLSLDKAQAEYHATLWLHHNNEFKLRLHQVIQRHQESHDNSQLPDVDNALYHGNFLKDNDQATCQRIQHTTSYQKLKAMKPHFIDERLPQLFQRYLQHNYPHEATSTRKRQWYHHCWQQLTKPSHASKLTFEQFYIELATLELKDPLNKEDQALLNDLRRFAEQLQRRLEIAL